MILDLLEKEVKRSNLTQATGGFVALAVSSGLLGFGVTGWPVLSLVGGWLLFDAWRFERRAARLDKYLPDLDFEG